ncbi:MAG: hypothetical protein AAF146_14140 [Bacteroidota bacterium]
MKLINIKTGAAIAGEINSVSTSERKALKNNPGFTFDWSVELDQEVYALSDQENEVLLGLIALTDHPFELRIHIDLIDSRKEQRGRYKTIGNIAACLIAYACRAAFKRGYGGFVSLLPKTQLISYYEQYGFARVGRLMAISGKAAESLIHKYLGDEEI